MASPSPSAAKTARHWQRKGSTSAFIFALSAVFRNGACAASSALHQQPALPCMAKKIAGGRPADREEMAKNV